MSYLSSSVEWADADVAEADDYSCRERDRPLSFHWKVQGDHLSHLVGPKNRKGYNHALRSILTEAILAHDEGRWVSYSRRKEFYAGLRRYHGTSYTYTNVTEAVEHALALDLIEEERALPGDHLRTQRQSRIRATPLLVERFRGTSLQYEPHETIRLRDKKGDLCGYDDTAKTRQMRREMRDINEFLRHLDIDLTAPGVSGKRAAPADRVL